MPGPQFFFFVAVALVTVAAAINFAFRPSERRLAVIRPLCAATICAGLASFLIGIANGLTALRYVLSDTSGTAPPWHAWLPGLAESFAPLIIAFAGVAVAWLLVAVGLRRQA